MPGRLFPSSRYARLRLGMVSHGVIASVVFGGAAMLAPATAGAQTPTPAPAQVPPIAVEADRPTDYKVERPSSPKYTEPLRDIPQSITIVPKQVIEERGASTLRDALRNVSGISLVAGEGGGAQGDNIRIRGFAANTDIFIDGIRDIAQYQRDTFNLEQLEVAKGPSGAYAGRGSTGGALNIVSKMPRLESFSESQLSFGTDQTKRVTLDVNQPLTGIGIQGAAIRINVMGHNQDVADRDNIEYKRWGIAPSIGFGLGTPTRLTFSYFHVDEDNVPEYGLPLANGRFIPGVDRSNFYGFDGVNVEETTTDIGTVRLEHDFNDAIGLRSTLRYSENTRFAVVCAPRNTPPSRNVTCGPFAGRDTENTLLINQTDVTTRFNTGPVNHALVTGVEVSKETFDNQALSFTFPTAPTFDLFEPNANQPFTGVRSNGTFTENEGKSLAFYAFDTLKIGEQLEIVGGLRWDRFDLDTSSRTAAGVVTSQDRVDEELTWRAAVIYKPLPNGSVYIAAGTSFNPSAEGGTVSAANAVVAPEETTTYEVGTKWDLMNGRLGVNAAVFRIEKTNARTPGLPGEPPTVLDGEQRVDGFEIGVTGNVTDAWKIFASYTYLDSEITKSKNPLEVGNEIGRTPPHTFNLWTTYELPWNIQIGAGAQYVSEQTVSNTNTAKLESYWLFDALIAYHLTQNVDLRLNIYNITDEFYVLQAHGGGGHGVPGPGRSALLTAALRF